MTQVNSMKLVPALLLVAFSGAAGASGFQLLEQNASGLANAYAGSAAVADNASTIFFNPAGMTQLQAREFSVGVAAIGPTFKFHNNGSTVGSLAGTGEGGNAGGWAGLPNGYLSWALSKDLYVGVGVGAPFGLKTEYDTPWLGAAQAIKFEVKTYNINPSIAYRVNDTVSLGAGASWQKVQAEYIRLATTGGAGNPVVFGNRVTSTMNLYDTAWGWNLGALFTISPSTKVGVSYRSEVKYETQGHVSLTSDGSAFGNATTAGLVAGGRQSDLSASLTLPDTFIMSGTHRLNDKWEMLGDVSWTGWSSIPKVDIMRTTGLLSGQNAQTLDTDFRDTWRYALGANYRYDDAWKLKFGVAYDQTPVKGADTRLTSLPDNNRVWLSFGAQWAIDKASRLDMGLTYIFLKDSQINNNQTAAGRGTVTGDYSASLWILGGQYSMAF